jgi:hypothetical protein
LANPRRRTFSRGRGFLLRVRLYARQRAKPLQARQASLGSKESRFAIDPGTRPMQTELTFCTTKELIAELMSRKTFLGVVVHSEQDFRGSGWGDERMFQVSYNSNLDSVQAARLLDTVAEYMDLHC